MLQTHLESKIQVTAESSELHIILEDIKGLPSVKPVAFHWPGSGVGLSTWSFRNGSADSSEGARHCSQIPAPVAAIALQGNGGKALSAGMWLDIHKEQISLERRGYIYPRSVWVQCPVKSTEKALMKFSQMAMRVNRRDLQLFSKIKLYVEMQMAVESDVAITQASCSRTKFSVTTLEF